MPEGGHPIEVQSQDVVRFKGSLYYVNEPEPTPKTLMVRHLCKAQTVAIVILYWAQLRECQGRSRDT
jgi:hypothetical protein